MLNVSYMGSKMGVVKSMEVPTKHKKKAISKNSNKNRKHKPWQENLIFEKQWNSQTQASVIKVNIQVTLEVKKKNVN